MGVDEGPVELTYRSGESYPAADLERMSAAEPKGPYRSAVSVPVGDRGTFQTVAETPGAFDEPDPRRSARRRPSGRSRPALRIGPRTGRAGRGR
ncbi:hypothetical protein BRD05_00675 [Halobacteriales archaeon QS_9_70_65]|nr:MAG: hypothetical protein BRD05_00675 [Halobacteriales archaeon QS_9_70_65]